MAEVRLPSLPAGRVLLERELLLEAARRLYGRQVIAATADRRAELPHPHAHRLEAAARERQGR